MISIKQYSELYFHVKFLHSILTGRKPYWRKLFSKSTDTGYPTETTGCSVSLIFLTAPLKESCWHMVFLGNRVMGEGTSLLLSPINLSLSQDLGRPKALMAIYIESQSLRIVSQFLWQHSSYKNTAWNHSSSSSRHPRVLADIPSAVNFSSKHARLCKLALTPPLAEQTAWNAPGANGQRLLPLPPALPPASLQHPHWGLASQAVGMENHPKKNTFLSCPAAFSSPSKRNEKSITQKIKMEKTEITAAFTVAKIMQ